MVKFVNSQPRYIRYGNNCCKSRLLRCGGGNTSTARDVPGTGTPGNAAAAAAAAAATLFGALAVLSAAFCVPLVVVVTGGGVVRVIATPQPTTRYRGWPSCTETKSAEGGAC